MNFLVATDFSQSAYDAFLSACDLANKFEGTLYLFHAADLKDGLRDPSSDAKPTDMASQQIIDEAQKNLASLKKEAEERQIDTQIQYHHGPLLDNLLDTVETLNIDMVIIGSTGQEKKKNSWGSNTQKIVRTLKCLVMIISEHPKDLDFVTVMFATNLDKKERKGLTKLVRFLAPYEIDRIHLVAIDTPDYFSQPTLIMKQALEEFRDLVGPYDCETHFFRDISIEGGILRFSREQNVDLVALVNSHKSPILRMLQGSKLENLAILSEVAVLSIS